MPQCPVGIISGRPWSWRRGMQLFVLFLTDGDNFISGEKFSIMRVAVIFGAFFVMFNTDSVSPGLGRSASSFIELHSPAIHYIYSGDLRLSYKLIRPHRAASSFVKLIELKNNITLATQNVTLPPVNIWRVIEFPCALLTPPGTYTVKLLLPATDNEPEITSQPVEIRWLERVTWNVSLQTLRIFTDPLQVNVSLHTQATACPQEEPANFSLVVKLNYRNKPGDDAGVQIDSRGLQWPFGSSRSGPRNSTTLFPCQLFDRIGSYYVTLAIRIAGREAIILGQSSVVQAIHDTRDYALLVNGDVRTCRDDPSRREAGVRVTYSAPSCGAGHGDKIRLYRIPLSSYQPGKKLESLNMTYLIERSVRSRPRHASFNYPCHIFTAQHDTLGFCWIYSIGSRDGQSKELVETRRCFPYSLDAEKGSPQAGVLIASPDSGLLLTLVSTQYLLIYGSYSTTTQRQPGYNPVMKHDVWDLEDRSVWSNWSSWSPCTATCRNGPDLPVRMRKRICSQKSLGIFQYGCEGVSVETKPCNVTLCHGLRNYERRIGLETRNVFTWHPDSGMLAEMTRNQTSILVYHLYEGNDIWRRVTIVSTSDLCLYVLPALGLVLILSLGCSIYDIYAKKSPVAVQTRERPKHSENDNRDSHYALISQEDEPANTSMAPRKVARVDDLQPSRSGVMEMKTLSPGPLVNQMNETSERHKDRRPGHVPSPLVLKRACRAKQSQSESDQGSSSHISAHPEASDVDFEYDDFIPDKLEEVEELWTPQRLDIKIFATAYEDIVKELNGSKDLAPICSKETL